MPSNQQFPVINAGALPAASVLQAFAPIESWKTSATARTTTTLSIDPDLQLTVAANCTYEIEARLIFAGTSGGFAWTWTAPAGISGGYVAAFNNQGSGTPGVGDYGLAWTASGLAATPSSGVVQGVILGGTLVTGVTAGTFGLNWALNSGSTSLSLGVGSKLKALRIA